MAFDDSFPSPVEAEMHIRGELTRLGIGFKEDHNSFGIVCPHPHPGGGVNMKRNLRIKKDGTTSFCFVCRATGSWNKVAGHIGAQRFGSGGLVDEAAADLNLAAAVRRRLADMMAQEIDSDEGEVPEGMTPWVGSWRGMNEEFLRSVHAHRWFQEMGGRQVERIWFPCLQLGEYIGYVSRRLDSIDIMRYYNAPWMKSSQTYFGFDRARTLGGDAIVLVEGPVDALKLLSFGVPAMAILGTNNIGEKEAILNACGYKRAFVLFDADAAGMEAAPIQAARLRRVMNHVEIVALPPGRKDPDELDLPEASWLRFHIQSAGL